MMKLVFASDSLKGTLSSREAAELLTEAARMAFGEDRCECVSIPIADGGEGTVDAVIEAGGGSRVEVPVLDPLHRPINACYGKIDDHTAIIEMAAASGITLLGTHELNPMLTDTYGTGQLIADALDRGFRDIIIGIGGSATNDGGMGCMRALGVRFFDSSGTELQGCGAHLARVAHIDASGIDERLLQSRVTVMCDVDNPLCGPHGATHTYARQKGATDAMIDALETGMQHYQHQLLQHSHTSTLAPGAGAAGGLGAALQVFAHATMRSGIEMLLDLCKFDAKIAQAHAVVTGEGRVDHQSAHGKVLWGIARRCREHNVPLYALVGSKTGDCREIIDSGVTKIYAITDYFSLDYAITHARDAYLSTARRMFQEIISKINPNR